VAAVDNVMRLSVVCASEFGRKLVGDPEAVCQGRWNLASRDVESFECIRGSLPRYDYHHIRVQVH
jgi:hypothetical protein